MDKGGPGRVIYVGSIPYDQTEEQILDIFRSVGPVANFRLVFDKDTGKSKGFAFVEYHDAETASSAVRNLNNYAMGPRSLRVDFSHETSIGPNVFSTARGQGTPDPSGPSSRLGQLPQGTTPAPGVQPAEAISNTINGFDADKQQRLLRDFQSLVASDPSLATELLGTSPQLSFALVQILLARGAVSPKDISQLVDSSSAVAPPSGPSAEQVPIQPAPAQSQEAQKPDPQQAELIKQVMLLTEQQVNALPAEQRDAIARLRQRVQSGEIQL